ncbi:MAG: site-specific integrase [Euryarchaeota archaeon]|nr:site-specific integrase [Euryarchaeota archaeon]
MERFLSHKHLEGLKGSTLVHYARYLRNLDAFLGGAGFASLTPDQMHAHLVRAGNKVGQTTLAQMSAYLRHFLRFLRDDEPLPAPWRRAMRIRAPTSMSNVQPVTKAEFDQLLSVAEGLLGQTLLWMLWDTGFRISELLSLNLGSIAFDEAGGARLTLDRHARKLKTGPRSIYVVDCVPVLRAYVATHGDGGNREAPLFPNQRRSRTGNGRMIPVTVHQKLYRWTAQLGMRDMWPHLFRHTRATRAARAGWNEAQLRAYFGWTGSSHMPSVYIHLAARDMEEQVRRDAGIDPHGARLGNPLQERMIAKDVLAAALADLLVEARRRQVPGT